MNMHSLRLYDTKLHLKLIRFSSFLTNVTVLKKNEIFIKHYRVNYKNTECILHFLFIYTFKRLYNCILCNKQADLRSFTDRFCVKGAMSIRPLEIVTEVKDGTVPRIIMFEALDEVWNIWLSTLILFNIRKMNAIFFVGCMCLCMLIWFGSGNKGIGDIF